MKWPLNLQYLENDTKRLAEIRVNRIEARGKGEDTQLLDENLGDVSTLKAWWTWRTLVLIPLLDAKTLWLFMFFKCRQHPSVLPTPEDFTEPCLHAAFTKKLEIP